MVLGPAIRPSTGREIVDRTVTTSRHSLGNCDAGVMILNGCSPPWPIVLISRIAPQGGLGGEAWSCRGYCFFGTEILSGCWRIFPDRQPIRKPFPSGGVGGC